jgi:integrase
MSVDKITQRTVSRLAPGQTVWDESLKGFGIRRQRQAAVYIFKYRQGGKQGFKTIGRHGSPWTADMARQIARRYLLELIEGRAPAVGADDTPPTFSQFAERYIAEYAHGRKKPRTLAEDRRNLDQHILPALGALLLDQVTRRDVVGFHARHHGYPVNANRCLSLISHIFTVAEKWELRPTGSNPCRGLDRYPERRRERWLDAEELGRLGGVLDRCERPGALGDGAVDWRAVACIRLLILTGARLGEVLGLQWSWINWERGCARLPDSKTGPKTVPLPSPALNLLAALKTRRHDEAGGKFVLPTGQSHAHFRAIQKPWQQIRKLAGLPDVRIHDLRHCYASFAVAGGESLYMVGAILGHRSTATTQRYAHLAQDTIAQAAGRTAERLAQLLTLQADEPGQISGCHAAHRVQKHRNPGRPTSIEVRTALPSSARAEAAE